MKHYQCHVPACQVIEISLNSIFMYASGDVTCQHISSSPHPSPAGHPPCSQLLLLITSPTTPNRPHRGPIGDTAPIACEACSRLASLGYFCCTSSCVRVASAYDSALTISPSVRDSEAARSKYLSASVTLPCWRRSCASVATAISHSGSTGNYLSVRKDMQRLRKDLLSRAS